MEERQATTGSSSLPSGPSANSLGKGGSSGSINVSQLSGALSPGGGSIGNSTSNLASNSHPQQQQNLNGGQGNNTSQQQQVTSTDENPRYVRRNFIAKGSHKVVYHAFDEEEGIEVAWNEIDTSSIAELSKVRREIHLLQSLDHPNIIKCHSSWVDEERKTLVFITELMTSGTLTDFIGQQSSQSLKAHVMVKYSRQILSGLAYLASQDVIHRDLKSNNIFINGHKGEVKIGDLGLSIASRAANSVLGTPEYMAPEIYEENYTNAVDIWSFGMCMLQMVSGNHPYRECENVGQIFRKVTKGILPEASESVADPMVKEVIFSCLDLDPAKRLSAEQILNHPLFKKEEAPEPEVGPSESAETTPPGPTATTAPLVETVKQQSQEGSERQAEMTTPSKESSTSDPKLQSNPESMGGGTSDVSAPRVVAWIQSGPKALQAAFARFALEKEWIEPKHHNEWREGFTAGALDAAVLGDSPDVRLAAENTSPSHSDKSHDTIPDLLGQQQYNPSSSQMRASTELLGSVEDLFSIGSNGSLPGNCANGASNKTTTSVSNGTHSIPRPASTNNIGTPLNGGEQHKTDQKKAAELTEQKLLAQMMGGPRANEDHPPPYAPQASTEEE